MKKTVLIILLLLSHSLFAQQAPKVSTFHRLLIFNDSNELMVVKIKNTNFWVTPGIYQDEHSTIKNGLESLAETYGFKINTPQLRGVFSLLGDDKNISVRLIYSTTIRSGSLKSPDSIEFVRWLPAEEAMQLITFPHINAQIRQITEHPDAVWGGSQTRSKNADGSYSADLTENFYVLHGASE